MPSLWRRRGRSTEAGEHAVTEATPVVVPKTTAVPSARGFVADVPLGGTTKQNPGYAGETDRRSFLDELYGAYLACPWASACVDTTARTVTAGGLEIVPDNDSADPDASKAPPAEVRAAQELLEFVNPREDARQLMRGGLTDAGIFGDAFFEVVWFAGRPVAVYSLDAPSMVPIADEHGTVLGYAQVLDPQRVVDFEPHEVIHVSLDAPRGGLYGVGPTQKNILPITAWLFAAGLLKETMRQGNPPDIHFDFPLEVSESETKRQLQQYRVQNLGIDNLGNPFFTRGGAKGNLLRQNQIKEYLETLNQKRDEIVSGYGVPPSKVGIIESGNLGGGTGTSQDKTFRVNTCGPIGEAFLEKFTFHLLREAFGVEGWRAKFGDVDWRDDKVVEEIRDTRIRNGQWTINRAREEIGEPAVPGGDDPVLVDRQNLVLVADLPDYSKAAVTALRNKGGGAAVVAASGAMPDVPAKESVTEADTPTGVMVALVPPAVHAAALAVDSGLAPDDLHVTLVYLGKTVDDPDVLTAVVKAWALQTSPLQVTVSGLGLFAPGDSSDGQHVTYASIDAPGLASARERLVEMLTAAGIEPASEHGSTPHMTLAYDNVIGDLAVQTPSWTAGEVVVAIGPDREAFPLAGATEAALLLSDARRRAFEELTA